MLKALCVYVLFNNLSIACPKPIEYYPLDVMRIGSMWILLHSKAYYYNVEQRLVIKGEQIGFINSFE